MTSRVRVLWLVKGLGRGGAEQLLLDLARELDRSTFAIEVGFVLPHKDALVADLQTAGVTAHCLSGTGAPWPVALRRLLARGAFDVIHTHSPQVAAAARMLAPRRSTVFHTEHNMWERYRLPSRAANALTMRRNSRVWAVSAGVADSMTPTCLTRGVDVLVLRHGLGERSVVTTPESRARALRLLGLTPGPFTVGTVGNLTAKKDHETLVGAVQVLRQTCPRARLVIVGGGPKAVPLSDLVAERGLQDAVLLTGVRDDVPLLLPAFDVFAMSSRYEGLSVALLEAMAAGVPPVVTRVGGMPEVIRDGCDGLLVPPGDPEQLAGAISRLATDHDLRSELAERARLRSHDFGIGPAAETLAEAYLATCRPEEVAAP